MANENRKFSLQNISPPLSPGADIGPRKKTSVMQLFRGKGFRFWKITPENMSQKFRAIPTNKAMYARLRHGLGLSRVYENGQENRSRHRGRIRRHPNWQRVTLSARRKLRTPAAELSQSGEALPGILPPKLKIRNKLDENSKQSSKCLLS